MKCRHAVFALALLGITMSCSHDSVTKTTNVYVVGSEYSSTINQVKFWKIIIAASLATAGKGSEAREVFVSENDVSIAGQEVISTPTVHIKPVKQWLLF